MTRKGVIQKKVMLLLLAGVALSFTRSPKKQLRIIREARDEWKKIDEKALKKAITSLYASRLINQKDNKDGTTTFELSKVGKRVALTYNLDSIQVVRHSWDRKWRIVIFDIPENLKKIRDALRYHLKRLGFIELQHSVFVLPFECKGEVEYITEFYNIKRFVRYIEAHHIDNELDLTRKFEII